jgi:hypothetical protein
MNSSRKSIVGSTSTRRRDRLLFVVVNVSAVAWSFFFAYKLGFTRFLIVLMVSLVILNLALVMGVKFRNRNIF